MLCQVKARICLATADYNELTMLSLFHLTKFYFLLQITLSFNNKFFKKNKLRYMLEKFHFIPAFK